MKPKELVKGKIDLSISIASKLIVEHGLLDWTIRLNDSRKFPAQTDHSKKIIYFSRRFLLVTNIKELEGVTLHEIAHALLGAGNGHNSKFIRLCDDIGLTEPYNTPQCNIIISLYKTFCDRCGTKGSSNTRDRTYCAVCFNESKIIQLNVTRNTIKVRPLF